MPVSKEMPDDEQTVLVAESNGDVRVAWHEDGEWRECASACVLPEVTHWMPMPEPPECGGTRAAAGGRQ